MLLAFAQGPTAWAGEVVVPTDSSVAPGAEEAQSGRSDVPKGHGYGGRALGPMPLVVLPDDPAHPVPAPPEAPAALPQQVDAVPDWQENVVCDPVDRPGLEAFGNLIGGHYGRPGFTTSRACIDQRSEHYDGRAIDWQLNAHDPADRRIGDAAVSWLTADGGAVAKRFGIQSIIWNERVWHAYNDTGWRGYVGQSPHTDHVHFSFSWDGAAMRTSWWTGVAVEQPDLGPCQVLAGQYAAIPQAPRTEACPTGQQLAPQTGLADVRPGAGGAGVGLVQPLLPVEQTGVLDTATREALLVWQAEQSVPVTGVLDQMTYAAALGQQLPELPKAAWAVEPPEHMVTAFTPHKRAVLQAGDAGEAVAVLQEALGVEADGRFGPRTEAALEEFTTEHPLLRPSRTTTPLTWHLLEQRAHPTLAYRGAELAVGAQGVHVAVLQQQLNLEADGKFGPVTEAAVREAQVEAGLEQTGVVDGSTWAATDQGTGTGMLGDTGVSVDDRGFTRVGGVIVLSQSDRPTESE